MIRRIVFGIYFLTCVLRVEGCFKTVDLAQQHTEYHRLPHYLAPPSEKNIPSRRCFFSSVKAATAYAFQGFMARLDLGDNVSDALMRFVQEKADSKVIIVSSIESDYLTLAAICKDLKERKIIDDRFRVIRPNTTIVFNGSLIDAAQGGRALDTLSLALSFDKLNLWNAGWGENVFIKSKNIIYVTGPGEKGCMQEKLFVDAVRCLGDEVMWMHKGKKDLASFFSFLPHFVVDINRRFLISSYPPWAEEMTANRKLYMVDSWKRAEAEELAIIPIKKIGSTDKALDFNAYVTASADRCTRHDIGSRVLYRGPDYNKSPVWIVRSTPKLSATGIWGHAGYVEISGAEDPTQSIIETFEYDGERFVPGLTCNFLSGECIERCRPALFTHAVSDNFLEHIGGHLSVIEQRLEQIESRLSRIIESASTMNLNELLDFSGSLCTESIVKELSNITLQIGMQDQEERIKQVYASILNHYNLMVNEYERVFIQMGAAGASSGPEKVPDPTLVIGATWDVNKNAHLLDSTVSAGIALAVSQAQKYQSASQKLKKQLKLVYLDDGGDSLQASKNIEALITEYNADFLIGLSSFDLAPVVRDNINEHKTTVIGPISGSFELQQAKNSSVINLRVSYTDEARVLLNYVLRSRPVQRLLIVHERGRRHSTEALVGTQEAVAQYEKSNPPLEVKAFDRNDRTLISALESFDPEVVLFLVSGEICVNLLPRIGLDALHDKLLVATSSADDTRTRQILRDHGLDVLFAHPIPSYRDGIEIAVAYRKACAEYAIRPSQAGFYGYIAAKLVLEQLQEFPDDTSQEIVRRLEKITDSSWHGLSLTFNQRYRRLLHHIWIEPAGTEAPWTALRVNDEEPR